MTKIDWRNDIDVYHIPKPLQFMGLNSVITLIGLMVFIMGNVFTSSVEPRNAFFILSYFIAGGLIIFVDWYADWFDRKKEEREAARGYLFNN